MTQTTFTDNVLVDGSQDIKQLRVQGHTTQTQPLETWENSGGAVLAQVTGDGRLEIVNQQDKEALKVQGFTTQNQPLQTWRDSAGGTLAQVTGDGRFLVGDDVGLASPDALIEAHRAETSTSKPKRGFHSLGRVSGALATLVQWIVQELELRGSNNIDALHTALRVRLSNFNTGTPQSNAELRAADVEIIQDATAAAAALPKATGLQVAVTNASGKTITDAVALRLKLNNAGTITNPYAIYSEGPGITHLESFLEIKQSAAPVTPATDFMRLYPKSDGRLYAKNWSGTEYDLTGGGGGSSISFAVIEDQKAQNTAGGASVATTWTTRDLNTIVVDADSILNPLSSNTFKPVAGTYRIHLEAPFLSNSGAVNTIIRLRLQNTTDGTTVAIGSNFYIGQSMTAGQTALLDHQFTTDGTKYFALQYYATQARAGNGLGLQINESSAVERYSRVVIHKLS